jgi:hypothetical protein
MTSQVLTTVDRLELIDGLRCFFSNEEYFLFCYTTSPYEWIKERRAVRLNCDVEATADELEIGVHLITRM